MQKVIKYGRINNSLWLKFLKGVLIGSSVVIPGFCTALFSMLLKEYDTLLEIIEGFYKPKIIKKYWYFVLGFILGGLIILLLLNYLFKEYRILLECFFLGISISGFFSLFKQTRKIKIVEFFIIIIGILFSLLPEILLLNSTESSNVLLIIVGGMLSALAFIMPGISGSMVLLSLGIYPVIISCFSNCLMFMGNSKEIFTCIIFVFSLGFSAIIFSKVIRKVIDKFNHIFIVFCTGLLIGLIVVIFINIISYEYYFIIKLLAIIFGILVMNIFK